MLLTAPLFVPECYADTALMLTLLRENPANQKQLRNFYVNHQHGIGNVGNLMQQRWKDHGQSRRVVGLVDLDKKFDEQPYLREFTRVVAGSLERRQHSFVLLQHHERLTQFLLVLNPAFEDWLDARAAECGTSRAACGLETDSKRFKRYCHQVDTLNDGSKLRHLLDAIATARPPAYTALAEFVSRVMDLERPLP